MLIASLGKMWVEFIWLMEQVNREGWQPTEFLCSFCSDSDQSDINIRIDTRTPDPYPKDWLVLVILWCHIVQATSKLAAIIPMCFRYVHSG
jgi:hypothetical protein